MVNVPARGPETVGVKLTLIVQLAPAVRTEATAQDVPDADTAKSPLAAILLIGSATLPAFVSVTDWLALVVVIG